MNRDWKRKIKEEFGAPAKVVILSYAESRYSQRLTAACLSISKDTLQRYCEAEGIRFVARIDQREECKPHGKGWPKGKARR